MDSHNADLELAEEIARCYDDPLRFALIAYPWGEPGTPLASYDGPCPCQRKVLERIGEEVRKRKFNGVDPVAPIRIAVSSGHGIGKSALAAMIVDWILSTRPRAKGTVTANTGTQLQTRTWAQIQAWTKLAITRHWFEITTERMWRQGDKNSWFIAAQTCREENSEAFAGQHAADSTSFYINDEGSAIPDAIYDVQEGGLTDGEPIQIIFGNPTRAQGKFYRVMFGSERERWIPIVIDSRECPLTNKEQIAEWVQDYGEDSDFVRVRVRGLPPKASDAQFISLDLVRAAQKRVPTCLADDPLIAGCDLAWGGEDANCVRFRKGSDARSIPPIRIPGELTRDPNAMVKVLADVLDGRYGLKHEKVAMLFLDSAGICGPVAARLRLLGYKNVIEVNFGADALNPKYSNMRSYMWGQMKEWLPTGAIDNGVSLEEDLTAPGYAIDKRVRIQLEEKKKIKERIGHSTDDGDALGLTFAMPVRSKEAQEERARRRQKPSSVVSAWS